MSILVSVVACTVPLVSVVSAGVLAYREKKGWGWFLLAAVMLFGIASSFGVVWPTDLKL